MIDTSVTIRVPGTIEQATSALGDIESLLHVKSWARAAIVAAYVRPETGGPRRQLSTSGRLEAETIGTAGRFSAREFSELGIVGLTSPTSVMRYVTAWHDQHNGTHPRPGHEVELPTIPFPASNKPRPECERKERPQRQRPPRDHDAVLALLKGYERELADPEFAQWVFDNVTPAKREAVAVIAERIAWAMQVIVEGLRADPTESEPF